MRTRLQKHSQNVLIQVKRPLCCCYCFRLACHSAFNARMIPIRAIMGRAFAANQLECRSSHFTDSGNG